jgi:hypothetical protein
LWIHAVPEIGIRDFIAVFLSPIRLKTGSFDVDGGTLKVPSRDYDKIVESAIGVLQRRKSFVHIPQGDAAVLEHGEV